MTGRSKPRRPGGRCWRSAATCVGSITQRGPFTVIDATGTMAGLAGSGQYTFNAMYATARVAGHCSKIPTAHVETIDGTAKVKA